MCTEIHDKKNLYNNIANKQNERKAATTTKKCLHGCIMVLPVSLLLWLADARNINQWDYIGKPLK